VTPIDAALPSDDAGYPGDDARPPAKPCHLVPSGAPARTLAFAEPTYSFRQNGLLARKGSTRVVQYGNVNGIRHGVWDDPSIYAAEYDVATWPPREIHGPTMLYYSMHDPADLLELPNGKLGMAWLCDNDGQGPYGTRFRTFDATTWQLDPDRIFIPSFGTMSPPTLLPAGDRIAAFHTRSMRLDGGARTAGVLGLFDLTGEALGAPPVAWTATTATDAPYITMPQATVGRSGGGMLVAIAFATCDAEIRSPYCEASSVVVLRLVEQTGAPPSLVKVASLPTRGPAKVPDDPHIFSDASHTWLTWWEADGPKDGGSSSDRYLYGVPLTESGAVDGPIESWFASDRIGVSAYSTRYPSVGPLGVIYPVDLYARSEAGTTRESHVIHRPIDGGPIEEVVVTSAASWFPIGAVQIEEPRLLVFGYSTYPPDGGARGYAEMVRFACREDSE
jgi:hypothetical protein